MTTRLTIFRAGTLVERMDGDHHGAAALAAALAARGVEYARWPLATATASPLDAYASALDEASARLGYQSRDVVALDADHPQAAAARQKFLAEHTHADDEARFFAVGGGTFYLRFPEDDLVVALSCTAGDWIRVPAGTRHWFDMGTRPTFTAIRLFTRPDGWVAAFTGDPVADQHPTHDALVAP